MNRFSITKYLFVLVGAGMLIGAMAWHSSTDRQFLARASRAQGTVVAMLPHYSNNSSSITYSPVVLLQQRLAGYPVQFIIEQQSTQLQHRCDRTGRLFGIESLRRQDRFVLLHMGWDAHPGTSRWSLPVGRRWADLRAAPTGARRRPPATRGHPGPGALPECSTHVQHTDQRQESVPGPRPMAGPQDLARARIRKPQPLVRSDGLHQAKGNPGLPREGESEELLRRPVVSAGVGVDPGRIDAN